MEQVSERRVRQESTNFVEDRRHSLVLEPSGVFGELVLKERFDLRVLDVAEHSLSERFLQQDTRQIEQRRVRIRQQCKKRVPEDVFHPRTPRVAPDLLHRRQYTARDQVAVRVVVFEDVKRDRVPDVRRVEIEEVVTPILRDAAQDALHEVAVRVDHGESVSVPQVGRDQVFQERRFPDARFPDQVEVVASVIPTDSKLPPLIPPVRLAEITEIVHSFIIRTFPPA